MSDLNCVVEAFEVSNLLTKARPVVILSSVPLPEPSASSDSHLEAFERGMAACGVKYEDGLPVMTQETVDAVKGIYTDFKVPQIALKDNIENCTTENTNLLHYVVPHCVLKAHQENMGRTYNTRRRSKMNSEASRDKPPKRAKVLQPTSRKPMVDEDPVEAVDEVQQHFERVVMYLKEFAKHFRDEDVQHIPFGKESRRNGRSMKLDWFYLSAQIESLRSRGTLHQVPVPALQDVLKIVLRQVRDGANVKLVTPCILPNQQDVLRVKKTLEAAQIALNIMTAPRISRSLLIEEMIEGIVAALAFHVPFTLFPIYDQSLTVSSRNKRNEPSSKKQRTSNEDPNEEIAYWKVISNIVNKIERYIISVLDKLQLYLRQETALELHILSILNICFRSFKIGNLHLFQHASVNVLTSIFLHYSNHRHEILTRLVHCFIDCPRKRQYQLSLQKNSTIHILTALTLHLLQCVPSISLEEKFESDLKDLYEDAHREKRVQVFQKLLVEPYQHVPGYTQTFAKTFMNVVAGKSCLRKEIMKDFVTDLLVVLFLPEWPAAESLLRCLVICLSNYAHREKEKHSVPVRLACLEAIGRICSKLKYHQREADENEITVPKKSNDVNPRGQPGKQGEDDKCICKKGYSDRFMLDCDDCHRWFHGDCVGIVPTNLPAQWKCFSCHIRNEVEIQRTRGRDKLFNVNGEQVRQLTREEADDELPEIEPEEILKQVIINYLTERSRDEDTTSMFKFSRQFHIAQWLAGPFLCSNPPQDAPTNASLDFFRSEWQIPDLELKEALPTFSREGVIRVNQQLARDRPLLSNFDSILSIILRALSEKQPSFRTKAMRALSAVVEADPLILSDKHVHKAVNDRFLDTSTAVREVSIDLVGKYIHYRPEFAEQYYPMLKSRIMDSGLSVRKRVIKILRDICLSSTNHPHYDEICVQLVQRVTDKEKSIQELVIHTIQQLWFSNSSKVISDRIDLDPEKMGIGEIPARTFTAAFQRLALQIVQVVGKVPNVGWMIDLMSELVEKEETKPKEHQQVHFICSDLCACIVNKMASLESDNGDHNSFAAVAPYMKTLHVFCTVRPMFLVPHATVLQPYLKSPSPKTTEQANVDGDILKCVSSMLLMTLPLIENPRPKFLFHCQADLKNIILSKGIPVIQVAIPCLCVLAQEVTKNVKVLEESLTLYYQFLSLRVKDATAPNRKRNVLRSLFSLGLLMKHFDSEKHSTMIKLGNSNRARHTDAVFHLYLEYCNIEQVEIKARSIQGLLFLFGRRPDLMIQATDIIKEALSRKSHAYLNQQTLVSLREFLESEEERLLMLQKQNAGKHKQVSDDCSSDDERRVQSGVHSLSKSVRSGDQSDTGIVAGVIQQFIKAVLELMHSQQYVIRDAALRLIRVILAHGIMNPANAMAHLVSLLADNVEHIRDGAYSVLSDMKTKYPAFFHSRLSEGIDLSFRLQLRIYGNDFQPLDEKRLHVVATCVDRLYSLIKEKVRTRNTFLNNILKVLDLDKCRKKVGNQNAMPYFIYLTYLVSMLHYDADEPYRIIRYINQTIPSKGGVIESNLNSTYKDMTEDASGNPVSNYTSKLVNRYVGLCEDGLAMSLLIMLSDYLRNAYNLSPQQIERWTASSKEKCQKKHHESFVISRLPYNHKHEIRQLKPQTHHELPTILREQNKFFRAKMDFSSSGSSQSLDDSFDEMKDSKENISSNTTHLNHEIAKSKQKSRPKPKQKSKPKPKQRAHQKHNNASKSRQKQANFVHTGPVRRSTRKRAAPKTRSPDSDYESDESDEDYTLSQNII